MGVAMTKHIRHLLLIMTKHILIDAMLSSMTKRLRMMTKQTIDDDALRSEVKYQGLHISQICFFFWLSKSKYQSEVFFYFFTCLLFYLFSKGLGIGWGLGLGWGLEFRVRVSG